MLQIAAVLERWADRKDETVIREYIRHQEKEDKRIDQLSLLK